MESRKEGKKERVNDYREICSKRDTGTYRLDVEVREMQYRVFASLRQLKDVCMKEIIVQNHKKKIQYRECGCSEFR